MNIDIDKFREIISPAFTEHNLDAIIRALKSCKIPHADIESVFKAGWDMGYAAQMEDMVTDEISDVDNAWNNYKDSFL